MTGPQLKFDGRSVGTSLLNRGRIKAGALVLFAASFVAGHSSHVPRTVVCVGLASSALLAASTIRGTWVASMRHVRAYGGIGGKTPRREYRATRASAVRWSAIVVVMAWLAAMVLAGIRPSLEHVPLSWGFHLLQPGLPRTDSAVSGLLIAIPLGWAIMALLTGSWQWATTGSIVAAGPALLWGSYPALYFVPELIVLALAVACSCPACGRMFGRETVSSQLLNRRSYRYTSVSETKEWRPGPIVVRDRYGDETTVDVGQVKTPVTTIKEGIGIEETWRHHQCCKGCGWKSTSDETRRH